MDNLPKDIKLHVLSFLTNRKRFNHLEKELEKTYGSMEEDRGYCFSYRIMKKINELEFLVPLTNLMKL